MTEPLSYHNNPQLKARFIGHVEAHREADRVLQRTYGDLVDGKWKGCAVACSLRSLDEIDGTASKENSRQYDSHADLAKRLGIPLILARLEDRIFEGLPAECAKHWPTRFAKAIPVGRDLSMVWAKLAVWILNDPACGVIRFAKRSATKEAIERVVTLYGEQVSGNAPSVTQWREARSAAAAAYAAAAAAAYAAAAAAAYAAAAYAAAYAAYAAAAAAAYAAAADATAYAKASARHKHYVLMSEKLLQLMSEA